MKYCSLSETAKRWGVSKTLVRRYCQQGRIIKAKQKDGVWMIPENAAKPTPLNAPEQKETSSLVNQITYQCGKNNHFGIYEYIQVNLAYSSSRMASNRLTRQQVEEVYRTNKLTSSFEPVKVDDIIEIVNHFAAMKFLVENINEPITLDMIQNIHSLLTYGTYAARNKKLVVGELRIGTSSYGKVPSEIEHTLIELIESYERKKKGMSIEKILDFHVRFECIRPFDDYNGRVGRLLLMKECLRHQIDPFIIDDKRRGEYLKGIREWKDDPSVLLEVVNQAQDRFRILLDTCRLMEYSRPTTGRGAR